MLRLRHALVLTLFALAATLAGAQTLFIAAHGGSGNQKAVQELAGEALRRADLSLSVVVLPAARSLASADAGEVDGEGLRVGGLSAQYPNLVQVPEPLMRVQVVAFAREPARTLQGGWNALKPHRVALVQGWKVIEAHAGVARTVHKVDRPEQLFQMLQAGHVDLALYLRADGLAVIRRLGLTDLVPLSPPLLDVDLYLYLHRRHQPLLARLAAAIRQMKADGTHAKLLAAMAAD